jgi:hypothetical protein
MPAILLAALLAGPQDEGKVSTGSDRASAVRIELSGRFDVHYFFRSAEVEATTAALAGLSPSGGATDAWAGRFSLRADVTLRDAVSAVLELENRSFDEGKNFFLSSNPETDSIAIKQGYVEAGEFLSPALALRVGVQDVTFRNRPHDEPFFMDLGEAEGFFSGFSGAAGIVRNTVDRDVREAVGVRALWSPTDFASLRAAGVVYGEGDVDSNGETVYVLAADTLLSERTAVWLLGALVSGSGADLGEVVTVGLGADGYVGEGRELELFGEAYVQRGRLTSRIRKAAFAFQAGFRYVGIFEPSLWLEAAVAHRSGDRRPGDRVDQAFQSYENENRFLVLESAEFGLDVDTNVSVLRAAVGASPFSIDGRAVRLRLDVGRFKADAPLRAASGSPLGAGEDDWGTEADFGAAWDLSASLRLWAKGAWLVGSRLLEELTPGRDPDAQVLAFGADLRF